MRARNLKPSMFRNELLAVADPLHTVIFQGLWCLADRAGRLEDRPAKIHLEINPGRAFDGTAKSISWLEEHGFIVRYEASGARYIQVVNFSKHQNPHCKEPESTIPAPCENGASTVPAGLIPDSGFLIPDCSISDRGAVPAEIAPDAKPEATKPKAKAAGRIPDDFDPGDVGRGYAKQHLPNVDVEAFIEEFRDYWKQASGPTSRKNDWLAAFRVRVRNCDRYPMVKAAPEKLVRYDARGRAIEA